MSKFGRELIQSAEEALAFARGEADLSEYRVTVPEDIDIKGIRGKLGMSQAAFANRFGFAVSALRDWEQNRRRPEQSARVLLTIIDHDPEFVQSALLSKLALEPVETNVRRVGKQGRTKVAAKKVSRIRA